MLSQFVSRRDELVLKRMRTGEARDAELLASIALPGPSSALVMTAIAVPVSQAFDQRLPVNPVVYAAAAVLVVIMFTAFAYWTAAWTRSAEAAQLTSMPIILLASLGPLGVPISGFAGELIDLTPGAAMSELVRIGWFGLDGADAETSTLDFAETWGAAAQPLLVIAAWTVVAIVARRALDALGAAVLSRRRIRRWSELTRVERVALYTRQSLYLMLWGFAASTLLAAALDPDNDEPAGALVAGGLVVTLAAFMAFVPMLRTVERRCPGGGSLPLFVRQCRATSPWRSRPGRTWPAARRCSWRWSRSSWCSRRCTAARSSSPSCWARGLLFGLVGGEPDGFAIGALIAAFFIFTVRASLWLLGIVKDLDEASHVKAQLAVVEERLRFSRDVHDVLGRRLSTIAVQAELAATLAARGDERAAERMLDVRSVAHEALREARELARGYRATDFLNELDGAGSLLRSAGIEVRVSVDAMPRAWHEAAGWVVRESVTNVLRHSSASRRGDLLRRRAAAGRQRRCRRGCVPGGSGLRGLRERLAPLGASLARRPGRRRPLGRRRAAPRLRPAQRQPQGGSRFMIRILLADDEHLIRTALAQMLDLEDDLSVVAEAAQGDVAVELAIEHAVDVAVLDLQMPGLDGIAVAEQLAERLPGCSCVIVTSHGRPGYLKRALAAGVRGFLPKTTSAVTLASVVRSVHAGRRHVDPELAAEAIAAGDSPLTPREADVLELAATGAPIDEIADRASLSPGTVRNYLSNAMTKLGASNRHEACSIARRLGWI